MKRPLALLGFVALAGCDGDRVPRGPAPSTGRFALNVTDVDTKFETRDHFIASVEMQLSGEPFAQAMGRDLGGYVRDYACALRAFTTTPTLRARMPARWKVGSISPVSRRRSNPTNTRSSR